MMSGGTESTSKWSKMISKLKDEEADAELEETHHDEDNVKESKDSTLTQAGGEGGSSSMSLSLAFSIQWLDRLCGIVPSSSKGRMIYMLTMLSIPLLPILALITQNIVLLTDTIQRKTDLLDADRSVLKSDETARLISALQQVRTRQQCLTINGE